jgi:hypothetical protein
MFSLFSCQVAGLRVGRTDLALPENRTAVRTTDTCGLDLSSQAEAYDTPRKEVIHPHLPVGIPCYDFTPVTDHSLVSAPLAVRLPTSGAIDSHGVTGGVYKTRERIHRSVLISDY